MGPGSSRQWRSRSHRALLSEKRKGTVTCVPSHRLPYPLRGCWLLHRALSRWRVSGRQTGRVDGQHEVGSWQPARSLGFHVPTLSGPHSPGMGWRVQGWGGCHHWPQTQGTPAVGAGTSSRVALVRSPGPRGCHLTQALPLAAPTPPSKLEPTLSLAEHPQVPRTPPPRSNCAGL